MTFDTNVDSTHNAYTINTGVMLDTVYFTYYMHNNALSKLKYTKVIM